MTRTMDKIERIWDGLLGGTFGVIRLDSAEETRTASLALVSQAQRSLRIFTHDLDAILYDAPDFVAAVRQLAIRSRGNTIEILMQNSANVVHNGHRLLTLAQKLSSIIKLRTPHPDYSGFNEAFLVVDRMGVIHRPQADRYEGTVAFRAPEHAGTLSAFFTEVWGRSSPDPELRRLYL